MLFLGNAGNLKPPSLAGEASRFELYRRLPAGFLAPCGGQDGEDSKLKIKCQIRQCIVEITVKMVIDECRARELKSNISGLRLENAIEYLN